MTSNSNHMEEQNTTKIIMALGINNGNILFHRADANGLYLGIKNNYKKLGEYTGKLLKLCENENPKVCYTLYDIITRADKPETEKVINLCYYLLQQDSEHIETIYNSVMELMKWQ